MALIRRLNSNRTSLKFMEVGEKTHFREREEHLQVYDVINQNEKLWDAKSWLDWRKYFGKPRREDCLRPGV